LTAFSRSETGGENFFDKFEKISLLAKRRGKTLSEYAIYNGDGQCALRCRTKKEGEKNMAFIDRQNDNDSTEPTFYNLNEAVGVGCKNQDEDVRLVQFFLKRIYLNEAMRARTPKGEMKVDGKCGAITRNWILKFQLDLRNAGRNVFPDGVVNRAQNGAVNSSLSRTVYVIRYLNTAMRKFEPLIYRTLPVHPDVPPELRLAFLQMQAAGPAMVYGRD
jgi:hypothetical protein